ncbi:proline--tRNA ligase [Prochlorococcus marinus]|uniref:Proline--tRNA ligase n=1 Tax=Prochlorococcus marinus XMU1408 TaxID=2213228 RepID=A0A318RFK9_PROMR|nr:proline--tRNA ligase [Prochlorococcus marinus]MBW3041535.1 proline--tRNA ligase [Prochlorococcus marinus str. XMU1408]PYE02693.1 proline--tRNA ligase [Prochlorococcus marinus XMU1408]
MRVSRLMLTTLRDVPAEADITSHQLLLRGGFIRRLTGGIYAYMPLLWKVLKKITLIVEAELEKKGCLQTLLPQLQPSELWEKSGRWKSYTEGEGIMFSLKDRQGKELGLGPTHEEVITQIISQTIHSYKQLPINIFQIQTKFRDEIRPRFGLMRSREFIMKDAYSFHANENDLKSTYIDMKNAYENIFTQCGLDFVCVDADSGAIGGAASQEFMVTAKTGEDLILISSDGNYGANEEKAVSIIDEEKLLDINKKPAIIKTYNQKTIEELCNHNDFHPTQIIKVLAYIATCDDNKKYPVLISIRGDQELNIVKLSNEISHNLKQNVLEIRAISNDDLLKEGILNIPFGFIGPDLNDNVLSNAKVWEKKFIRLADFSAKDLKIFICGNNIEDEHRVFYNWDLLNTNQQTCDLRKAKAGDRCFHDKNQKLKECRGIEIGHIFQLGTKYSKSLNANFTSDQGIEKPFWMGCYGIGISRLAQAAVEQNHDDSGIIWPVSIAPFEVIIIIANIKDINQRNLAEEIYKELINNRIDALLDDRDERAGTKFKDADLIGIPWRIVVGREANSGRVELHNRKTKLTESFDQVSILKKLSEEFNK